MNTLEQVRLREQLFGARSVPITTPQLVSRYNAALEYLGLRRTKLPAFRIDLMGWSAEVAEEQGDADYLWGGLASPLAVLITLAQAGADALLPAYSFDRLILRRYFEECGGAVADATSDGWLVLEFDGKLSCCKSPLDLGLIRSFVIRASGGERTKAAAEQSRLVERFQREPLGWFDAELRRALIASAARWGDLRERRLVIPDRSFSDTGVYYARAYGGVYVLRGLRRRRQLFVFEDGTLAASCKGSTEALSIDDAELAPLLFEEGLCGVHLTSYRECPALLEWKRECVAAEILCAEQPESDFLALNPLQRKRALAALRHRLPAVFHELECFASRLAAGDRTPLAGLGGETLLLLAEPLHAQPPAVRAALWQLLVRKDSRDVVQLARHHPAWFMERYQQWPRAKREWARRAAAGRIGFMPECQADEFERTSPAQAGLSEIHPEGAI